MIQIITLHRRILACIRECTLLLSALIRAWHIGTRDVRYIKWYRDSTRDDIIILLI